YSMAAILCELASGVSQPDLAEATEQLAAEQLSLADLLAHALSRSPDLRPTRPAELIHRIRKLFVDERVPTVKRPVLIRPEARRTEKAPALSRDPAAASGTATEVEDEEGLTIEESSPLFLEPAAAPRSPLFGPNQPTLTDQRAPSGSPPAASRPLPLSAPPDPAPDPVPEPEPPRLATPRPPEPLVVPLHSRRAPDDRAARATPILPTLDRPDMQPVLRPLSSLRSPAPAALGHYAPPREREPFAPPARRRLLLVIGGSGAVLLGAVALLLAPWGGEDEDRVAPVVRPPAPAPAPRPSPPPREAGPEPGAPCSDGMVLVAGDQLDAASDPYCIDRHEWPGSGRPPQLGASLEEAGAECQKRGARLCKPGEWQDACRGADRASFPYGAKYVDKVCNARGSEISGAGSFPECQSAAGAFDMSGNAAEWDAAGGVRGASATDGTRGRCSELRNRGKPRARASDRADIGFRCCADPLAQVTPTR
ncbi:MAG TPA: SUMF1/EgtB/PvdO family nonheme iron enzyme, partial [Kofleriaceae bacterium]|nr:SUMF1/EgtB/PvdO family nonheme iron enzyme [Kofleriaceae bacterium]